MNVSVCVCVCARLPTLCLDIARICVEIRLGLVCVLTQQCFCNFSLSLSYRPFCGRPYQKAKLPTLHTAVLKEPLTGELFMKGRPVSVARLVRFEFPADWSGPEAAELEGKGELLNTLCVGDLVACEPRTSQFHRIHGARVERIFRSERQIEVVLFHVPPGSRTGPWQRRRWEVWLTDDGNIRKEVVTEHELLCQVHLQEGALTTDALESLAGCGVDVGTQPRRDHTLPPRRQ